ncbi:MAG: glycosyltransferase [Eubacteriales bacterium]|nr:glycosyltransferase [Eubacteriales bacterium]
MSKRCESVEKDRGKGQVREQERSRTPVIWIRADGNEEIATGHLVRCLTIGAALKREGARVWLLVSDHGSERLAEQFMRSYEPYVPDGICVLGSRFDDPDGERQTLEKIWEGTDGGSAPCCCPRPDFVLVDSYFATESYLSFLQARVPTGYLDDMLRFDPPVSLVVNYDVVIPEQFYRTQEEMGGQGEFGEEDDSETGAGVLRTLLLGPSFAPLRPQFAAVPYTIRKNVSRILVSTGGSDPCGAALALVRRFEADPVLSRLEWEVVIGSLNRDRDVLRQLAEEVPQLRLRENVSDMAELMRKCDLAVTAGGTTLYELCAVGVPSVVYSMAENQIAEAEAFASAGIGFYEGDVREETFGESETGDAARRQMDSACGETRGGEQSGKGHGIGVFDRITARLSALCGDYPLRLEQSEKMRCLTDGRGAQKIAKEILRLCR